MDKNYRSDLTKSISPYRARKHLLPIGILVFKVGQIHVGHTVDQVIIEEGVVMVTTERMNGHRLS